MKRLNWFLMLMTAFTLSFVACTDSNVDDGQSGNPTDDPTEEDGPKEEGLTFKVEVGEVTSSSVSYTITPSDLEAEYLCVLYDAETVEEFTRDQFLVENLYQELETEARSKGQTLEEYMPEVVDKGAITDGKFSNLFPESKYYIIVFGVDAAKGYEANTAVSKTEVTTAEFVGLDVTFEINTTVDDNTAKYQITPSNDDDIWYFYTLPKSTYDAYTDPAGPYQMSEQRFLLFCLEREIEAYRGAGYTDNQILNAIFHKGAVTLQAKGLTAQTEYINMIAGFIITEEGAISIATDVTTSTYKTGDAKASDLTLDVSVTDVEAMRAAIKITPSDTKETFYWLVDVWDGKQTAEEIMNESVKMYGAYFNAGMMLYKGVQDYTGGPGSPYKYRVDDADTEHFVIAFGYAGGVTTDPVMKTFRTKPAPDAKDTSFELKSSNITPYSFALAVIPSESTTFWTTDIILPEEFNEDAIIENWNKDIKDYITQYQEANPTTTVAQALASALYRGTYSNIPAKGLTPETTYMGYVIAVDPKTGEVAKLHKFENLATTTALGTVTPKVELVGYYSGDEENGTIFGEPEASEGKAITVVKYTGLEGARSLFTAMLVDDMTNTATYSDSYIWSAAASYWRSCKISEPYSFYVAEWDTVQTAMAYAVDNTTGQPGGIGRLYTQATAENKGDIKDLKALVDEINAASKTFALPQSVVYREGVQISIDKVDAEVVEAKAEIKAETKAEVKALNPNEVFVCDSHIRPFYL